MYAWYSGVGNIGTAVVRRACAFGMKVVGADPVAPDPSFLLETGIVMMPLRQLLVEADFVSLHCDLNPTSFHLIGRAELNAMKSSAYLINTARGSVVDETALVEALRTKQIAGDDLHQFVQHGLIYPIRDFNWDPDSMLRFYNRPGWPNILRNFANIDDDAATINTRMAGAIRDLLTENRSTQLPKP